MGYESLPTDDDSAGAVKIGDIALRCEICKNESFWHRSAQLNTAVASFFGFDWANASADCYVCRNCGYIHWFLPK